jgi:hypothetical protein
MFNNVLIFLAVLLPVAMHGHFTSVFEKSSNTHYVPRRLPACSTTDRVPTLHSSTMPPLPGVYTEYCVTEYCVAGVEKIGFVFFCTTTSAFNE